MSDAKKMSELPDHRPGDPAEVCAGAIFVEIAALG